LCWNRVQVKNVKEEKIQAMFLATIETHKYHMEKAYIEKVY